MENESFALAAEKEKSTEKIKFVLFQIFYLIYLRYIVESFFEASVVCGSAQKSTKSRYGY